MKIEEKKQGMKKGLRGLLFSFLAFVLSFFGVGICLIINAGFGSFMFAYEPATSGVYDAAKAVMPNKESAFSYLYLMGEWEFYYNRWIVSDQDHQPADSYISLGESWGNRGFPKEGYGSYRLKIIHMTPGYALKVEEVPFFEACSFYLNGEYCGAYGIPGKSEDTSHIAGRFRDSKVISVPADGELTFVMELGYSRFGGMGNRPDFNVAVSAQDFAKHTTSPSYVFFNILTLAGLLIVAVIISICATILVMGRGQNIDPSILFFLLGLLLCFGCSYDGYILLETLAVSPLKRVMDACFVFTIVPIGACFIGMLTHAGLIPSVTRFKRGLIYGGYTLLSSLFSALAVASMGYPVSAYFWALALSMSLPGFFYAIKGCIEKKKGAWVSLVLLALVMDLEIIEYLDIEEFLLWKTLNVPSIAMTSFAIVAFVIFVQRTAQILKENGEKADKAKRYEIAKQQALRGQIKPHFIFNCLTAIEGTYHHSVEEGDHAMNLFAEHLRSDVDSMDENLIPFEEESKNVDHYLELENLRLEKKFQLLYDIDVVDFAVPPLSLQPLIENAVKYSRVNEKKEGYIFLRTKWNADKDILLEVEDNGVGFDPSGQNTHSQGLKNTAERFALILGASFSLFSAPGQGTRITIRIPHAGGEKRDEERFSLPSEAKG